MNQTHVLDTSSKVWKVYNIPDNIIHGEHNKIYSYLVRYIGATGVNYVRPIYYIGSLQIDKAQDINGLTFYLITNWHFPPATVEVIKIEAIKSQIWIEGNEDKWLNSIDQIIKYQYLVPGMRDISKQSSFVRQAYKDKPLSKTKRELFKTQQKLQDLAFDEQLDRLFNLDQ